LESGTTKSFLKRKSDPGSGPGGKKAKTEKPAPTAFDDPTRKYCLGKLKEIIVPIFRQYAVAAPPSPSKVDADGDTLFVDAAKDVVAMDEAEAEAKATTFTDELEQCVYTYYSEPDKKGNKSAGPKYKYVVDLAFNLSSILLFSFVPF
jgi:hypothetical protein